MPWVAVDIALAVAGLLALAVLALRLDRQVRTLAREVSAAAARISTAVAEVGDIALAEVADRVPQDRR